MTVQNRRKKCLTCGEFFTERYGDSNKQWEGRRFCGQACSNRSPERVVHIFHRIEKFQVKKIGCWEWTGSVDGAGYGIISNRDGRNNSPEKAHRVSYEKEYGEIPDGKNVCHKCDNPPCTNPAHLFAGTQKENMGDCSKKGRLNKKSLLNLRPGEIGFRGAGTKKQKDK